MASIQKSDVALSIPVDNTAVGASYRQENVQEILEEVRNKVVLNPTFTTTTNSGTLFLTTESNTSQVINGTATGFNINLPDATTLFQGEKFEIYNESDEELFLKDNGSNLLTEINSLDRVDCVLQDNTTSDGDWILTKYTTIAAGIQAFNITSDTPFITNSSSDIAITGMTVTPNSGTWAVLFASDCNITLNNATATCVIYKDGIVVNDSRRTQQGIGSNYKIAQTSMTILELAGSQSVDVRINITSGDLTINGRTLLLFRLG